MYVLDINGEKQLFDLPRSGPMELPIDFGVYNRAAYALIFSAFQGLIALVFGLALGRRLKSRADRWIIVWLIYNGLVHLTLVRRTRLHDIPIVALPAMTSREGRNIVFFN